MGVHRYAVATAVATFVLLIFGGLVSTTESGLACPDWPLCEGRFIPKMIDGKQYEHSHRLVASFVGTMTFGLTALLFKHRRRDRLLTRLGVVAAVGVTVQALLGALTVILKLPWWVSSSHLAVAMAFFALSVTLAILTRQRLDTLPRRPPSAAPAPKVRGLLLAVLALVYLQIAAGGVMRHLRGGLVCGYELLTCVGSIWPLDGHAGIQLHMLHRLLGVLSGVAVVALTLWLRRRPQLPLSARRLLWAASAGVLVQITLGALTILTSRELVTMTVHSSLAAALLAALVTAYWLIHPVPPLEPSASAVDTAPAAPAPEPA